MRYTYPIKKVVVFSKWSRTSYAIFASLGKLIKIAHVSADVADKALGKKTSLPYTLTDFSYFKNNPTSILEELWEAKVIPDALMKQLGLLMNFFMLFTSIQKESESASYILFRNQSPCFITIKAWTFYLFINEHY